MKKILLFAAMIAVVAAMVPAAAFAFSVGDSQTQDVNFQYVDVAARAAAGGVTNLNETWVQTVVATGVTVDNCPVTPPGPTALPVACDQVNATITPNNYTVSPPWPAGAVREVFSGVGGTTPDTAVIKNATSYLDGTTGMPVRMISQQAIFGGFLTNTAVVDISFGPPPPAYAAIPGAMTMVMSTGAYNPASPMSYVDTLATYPYGTSVFALPGCGNVPTVLTASDWLLSTSANVPACMNAGTCPVMNAITTEVPMLGPSISPLVQVDSYHFCQPEFQNATAASPCPPIPEVATIILISVGLIGLVGFALLKRRHAAATA